MFPLQNVPVTMAYVTTDCKGTGAASVSQDGRALPAKKVSECEGAHGVILPFWQRNLCELSKMTTVARALHPPESLTDCASSFLCMSCICGVTSPTAYEL